MGARHEKQIEAIHVDNIFIPEYRQGRLPVPARPNRSVMRFLFGIHALQQHHHPQHEQYQQPHHHLRHHHLHLDHAYQSYLIFDDALDHYMSDITY